MRVLVCVKEVPDLEGPIKVDRRGQWVELDRSIPFRMNRYDEFAVEEALLVKQSHPGVCVDIVSVGPPRSSAVIRRSLGMGADHGIHVVTEDAGYSSPFETAYRIAAVVGDRSYDVIFAGVMAEDDMQGQVGPMLGELLSLPCATGVVLEHVSPKSSTVYVERELEGGFKQALELRLPALLTIQTGINKPRYPSLSNMLRANRQDLETINARSSELPEWRERVTRTGYPLKRRSCVVLRGSSQEKAAELLRILREKSLLT